MLKKLCAIAVLNLFASTSYGDELRVFTWDGYVSDDEVKEVNDLLKQSGSKYSVKVIDTLAEGPEQMYEVLRSGKADVSFLTLNYIMMQQGKTAALLQPIDTSSPRLTNYKELLPSLTHISMGMKDGKPLYVPWGGGVYGIWANMAKLKSEELPHSVSDLWDAKWKGKLSLSGGQIQPNIALASISLGKKPFFINDDGEDRTKLMEYGKSDSEVQKKMNELYAQVGDFWEVGPDFSKKEIVLFADYGPGASAENAKGGNYRLVNFKEGNTIWLDTINIHKDVKGDKLEAAEIFINYHIGEKVQNRVAGGLGMVAASKLAKNNTLIEGNPDFFNKEMFWPPYLSQADNVMKKISKQAMKK